MNSQELKIFLSSTFVDLKDVREKILKFLSVLKSDVINMEVFGSDESQPKEYCLKKVKESNFFIGIYAERYGFIDPETGLSITQLEYVEAYEKLQDGSLKGLLLYVLDQNANWPVVYVDREAEKIEKMSLFKKEISQRHTLSYFKDVNELPFNILRDTIRKLEIGQHQYFKERVKGEVVLKDKLEKPVGMEFFDQELSNMFFGRRIEIDNLNSQILAYNFSLLIGVSGIGKTSLLNAGIISTLSSLGWTTSVIRPLNDPINNLKKLLWSQLMEGVVPTDFELIDIVRAILTSYKNKKVLIVIDQFEDILNCKSQADIDVVVYGLMQLHALKESNLHVLISYRGDVESELGMIWQKISGAADGLPRFYLKPLSQQTAREILLKTLKSLDLKIDESLLEIIIVDLHIESLSNGHADIFPPFLQMILVTIYENFNKYGKFDLDLYISLEGCKGIISGYLLNQLDYLGARKEEGIKALTALVSNYGTKTQKNIDEIANEAKVGKEILPDILSTLIDLRLIRVIDSYYEITHDLLAKNILANLITDEELNIRKFKFLLESKAASFASTNSGLTLIEHVYLYKYRNRIHCNADDLRLLSNSFKENKGPVFYWINAQNIYEKGGYRPFYLCALVEDNSKFYPFSNYKTKFGRDKPILGNDVTKNILNLTKSKSLKKLDFLFNYCNDNYLNELSCPISKDWIKSKKQWQNLVGVIGLGEYGKNEELTILVDLIGSSNEKVSFIAFKSLIKLSTTRKSHSYLIRAIEKYDKNGYEFLIEGFKEKFSSVIAIEDLFSLYEKVNYIDTKKGDFVLSIIRIIANEEQANSVKRFIEQQFLKQSPLIAISTEIINLGLSFCDEFKFFIELIRKTELNLTFLYYTYVHEEIAFLAKMSDYEYIKSFISSEVQHDGDWHQEYLNNYNNLYLVIWIMACAFSNLVLDEDKYLIFKMLNHNFWTVKNAAVRGLLRISNETDIDLVINNWLNSISYINNDGLTKALLALDDKHYLTDDVKRIIYNSYLEDDDLPF